MTDISQAVIELHDLHPMMSIDGLRPIDDSEPTGLLDLIAEAKRFPEQIAACQIWLAVCPVTKQNRTTHDTYSYKHEVEAIMDRWISHMSFIVAAHLEGFRIEPNPDRPWAGLLPLGKRRPGAI